MVLFFALAIFFSLATKALRHNVFYFIFLPLRP